MNLVFAMRYSRLQWNHDSQTEPVEILSEYDPKGWERRKIEVFADGSIHFASATESVGGCQLSLIQCPPDDEVVAEPEFQVYDLDKEDFEKFWNRARQMNLTSLGIHD